MSDRPPDEDTRAAYVGWRRWRPLRPYLQRLLGADWLVPALIGTGLTWRLDPETAEPTAETQAVAGSGSPRDPGAGE